MTDPSPKLASSSSTRPLSIGSDITVVAETGVLSLKRTCCDFGLTSGTTPLVTSGFVTEGGDDKAGSRAWLSGLLVTEDGGVELTGGRPPDDADGTGRGGGLSVGKEAELVDPVVTLEARYATEDCGCLPRGASILSTWNDRSSSSLVKHLLDMETTKRNFLEVTAESSRGVTGSPRADWTTSRSGATGERP